MFARSGNVPVREQRKEAFCHAQHGLSHHCVAIDLATRVVVTACEPPCKEPARGFEQSVVKGDTSCLRLR